MNEGLRCILGDVITAAVIAFDGYKVDGYHVQEKPFRVHFQIERDAVSSPMKRALFLSTLGQVAKQIVMAYGPIDLDIDVKRNDEEEGMFIATARKPQRNNNQQ